MHFASCKSIVAVSLKPFPFNVRRGATHEAVFTLMTGDCFLTSASKFYIEPNGGIFDVDPENDRASLNVKTASRVNPAATRLPFHCVSDAFCTTEAEVTWTRHALRQFSPQFQQ